MPSQRLIAHVDMNSYFASCEQQARPELRGKPLGVCAYLHEHGCVIAASVEAKKMGMKVGMTVAEARAGVPQAVFVENDPVKYRAITSRVFALFHELTDAVEHYSIDEAFLDLTGWYRDPAEAAWALTRVRARIRDEIGVWLRCSIGIAPTRFLAKTASDMKKPNGLTIITHENLDEMLAKLELEDVCGIGPRIRRRIERLGVHSLLELKRYPVGNLMRAMGKYGLFLHYKLHALECERITPHGTGEHIEPPKSIGHSYCVPRRSRATGRAESREDEAGKIVAILMRLTERAGRRMRKLGLCAGTVSVAVGFRDATIHAGPIGFASPVARGGYDFTHLPESAQDSFTLVGAACELLRGMLHPAPSGTGRHPAPSGAGRRPAPSGAGVNFLAVTLSDLVPPSQQGRLDSAGASWDPHRDRWRRISDAADLIRDRYGDEAVVIGDMIRLGDEAPDRIGFRKTEGIDITVNSVQ